MSIGIEIHVDIRSVQERFTKLNRELDTSKILGAIGDRLLKWTNDNIKQAGTEEKWKPMAKATLFARPQRESTSHFSSRWISRLRQSMVKNVGSNMVTVGTEDKLAQFHQDGSAPHIIRAVNKKFLRFISGDGTIVYARSVKHPGIAKRALLPSEGEAGKLAGAVVAAIVKRAAEE